ncbi:histidine phosphatase family protein [Psychromicrobium lacuslunae]|uniref:Histidine phosphatase n=1 Tax=Psychromicrobium lacuslunae TaxID=1618207 RepID=A0A0D4C0F1_9MICC|nr:histidine phosphatase family protein [Psychromicrobium lacuslunae]AJT41846.1 histidine phosphatase [Psychromicrobium lacuslunae]
MRLILIRHGQTPSNVRRLLDTAMPGPALTDLGSEQARALVPALADQPLDAIYSSVALRAQQTAQPLADERSLELQVREGVREIAAGELEMAGDLASIKKYLTVVFGWVVGQPELRMPGGETGTEVLERFDEVVQEALDAGHRSAAIISHGAMIRIWAASRAANADLQNPQQYDLSNTGVVILDYDNPDDNDDAARPWRLVSWTAEPAGGPSLADSKHDGPDLEGLSAEEN